MDRSLPPLGSHRVLTRSPLSRPWEGARLPSAPAGVPARLSEGLTRLKGDERLSQAGAYAIQGLGGLFVEGLRGSPSSVIGLPITLVADLLRRFGLDLWHLRR